MSGDHQFFPSVHDSSSTSSDIWSSLTFNTPKSSEQLFKPLPWPKTSSLSIAEYQPLDAFCPPEGPRWLSTTDQDVVSELGIRLVEIELLTIIGEHGDNHGKNFFLSEMDVHLRRIRLGRPLLQHPSSIY
ncbi:hypothetical protein AALO_G00188610 [Alosa alosa]|uniref:Uncharacterized protein n=1 Tax=Alosa alosa TaxID=278164 RepID=A0AAV6G4U4_9TELE|nr:hypothetical protein AALO_G00188610 [Alosa alosa]